MVVWTILSWVMSAIALAGTVFNAERNICGFWFWLISNLYMTIRFAYIGEYAQALLFFIYTLLAIRGLIAWRELQRPKMNEEEMKQALKTIKRSFDELETEFFEENKKP